VVFPERLYAALPYLYLVGGVLSFFSLPSPYRYISGGLLVLAGVSVMTMRRNARSQHPQHKRSSTSARPKK
jgi:hypothetical protein